MVFAIAALAIGTAITLISSANQARATEQADEFNRSAAEEDIKLLKIEEVQKKRIVREQGARQIGTIKAVAAASGVTQSSGSILSAVAEQVTINAQNEFLLGFEARTTAQRIRTAARAGSMQAANLATGQRLSGIGSALSGAGQIAGMGA